MGHRSAQIFKWSSVSRCMMINNSETSGDVVWFLICYVSRPLKSFCNLNLSKHLKK